jgi:hypothetical protein
VNEAKPTRRWFRFSLRTLFVLMTIVGFLAGWVAYQLNWIRQREEFQRTQVYETVLLENDLQRNTPWSLRLFGERNRSHSLVFGVKEPQIEIGRRLFPEADFIVYRPPKLIYP